MTTMNSANESEQLNDEQLMLSYKNGELAAFEMLYHRHKSAVFRFILRHGIETTIAEELLQDIWSSIIQARTNYVNSAKFTTWLYQIARNRLIDYHRTHKSHIQLLDEQNHAESPPNQSDKSAVADTFSKLHQVIRHIPFPQRQAFLLHYQAGLSVPEVAEVTDDNHEAVKSRIRYAVQKLKNHFGANDE